MNHTVYIRVDGNEIIATGHVMRCLSIAQALCKLHMEVVFLVADERPCDLICSRGFSVEVLHTIWDDLDKETDILCQYLKTKEAKVLLLDSYYVTPDYMEKLSRVTSVVYIDDLNSFLYPVHTVINYGIWSKECPYEENYKTASMKTHFLLGSEYVPLREEFQYQPYNVKEEVKKVLITVGGTDTLNVTENILQAVLKDNLLTNLEYHVIVGCFNQNKHRLEQLASVNTNVILHENVTNMSDWMRECDVAVSASGSTLYEMCACGIPTICLEIADNQCGAKRWETERYMLYAGNAMVDIGACKTNCAGHIHTYVENRKLRKEISEKIQSLVDGCGAQRIAQYMISI